MAIKHRNDASRNKLFLVNESMLLPPGAIINDVKAIIIGGGMAVNYKSLLIPISQMLTSNRRIYLGTIARDSLTAPGHSGDFSEDPIVLSYPQ